MVTGSRVTVVIITWNRKAELLHTLERMTALPDQAPVVVVDNGSTDHTADAVAERFGQVTLLRSVL
jgi:GT2 family glycosyltransferase